MGAVRTDAIDRRSMRLRLRVPFRRLDLSLRSHLRGAVMGDRLMLTLFALYLIFIACCMLGGFHHFLMMFGVGR